MKFSELTVPYSAVTNWAGILLKACDVSVCKLEDVPGDTAGICLGHDQGVSLGHEECAQMPSSATSPNDHSCAHVGRGRNTSA